MKWYEYNEELMNRMFWALGGKYAKEPEPYDWEYERRQQKEIAEERFLEHALEVLQEQRDALNAILSKMPEPKKLFPQLWDWQNQFDDAIAKLEDDYEI